MFATTSFMGFVKISECSRGIVAQGLENSFMNAHLFFILVRSS
jgi:hypothetical protein